MAHPGGAARNRLAEGRLPEPKKGPEGGAPRQREIPHTLLGSLLHRQSPSPPTGVFILLLDQHGLRMFV